jgi:hypothetical protein
MWLKISVLVLLADLLLIGVCSQIMGGPVGRHEPMWVSAIASAVNVLNLPGVLLVRALKSALWVYFIRVRVSFGEVIVINALLWGLVVSVARRVILLRR